jgi:hypothetical protein
VQNRHHPSLPLFEFLLFHYFFKYLWVNVDPVTVAFENLEKNSHKQKKPTTMWQNCQQHKQF